jgi:hypothetical protein
MSTAKIMAISLIAGVIALGTLAILPIQAAVPGPAYLQVVSGSATAQTSQTAKLSVTTNGNIPIRADSFINSNPVVGFAWADLSTAKAFVTTIHPSFKDDNQNPSGWHAHTVTLTGGATSPHDFCIASIDSSPEVGLSIQGNTMNVNIRLSTLPAGETPSSLAAVVGFTVQLDSACSSGLAVQVST